VSQQDLNDPDTYTGFKQMRGKAVSKRVGRNLFFLSQLLNRF
jgi:hypothetical protein